MRVGDIIVQRAVLPPVGFGLCAEFAVRVSALISEPSKLGFAYETLSGHLERGFASLAVHRLLARAAHQDRIARELRPVASLQRDRGRPARLHRDADSSSWSSTSCSTARERTRSRASLSAASITCETSARTSCEISGFHLLSFESSFSAMESTAGFYFHPQLDAILTSNQTMEPTTGRRTTKFSMTPTSHPAATCAIVTGRSACSR
jgi:hypothetical protein